MGDNPVRGQLGVDAAARLRYRGEGSMSVPLPPPSEGQPIWKARQRRQP